MKISGKILAVLIIALTQQGIAAENVSPVKNETDLNQEAKISVLNQSSATENQNVTESKYRAWQELCKAKNSQSADMRSEAYANAIKYINQALYTAEENAGTYLLASRIYRGKGGVSYAKDYFTRAAGIYLEDAIQNPESIQANLNAAIVLYAGDVRYWDSYEQSKENAWKYAEKVLELCKKETNEKKLTDRDKVFFEEAIALAFLIKENVKDSNIHFSKAQKIINNTKAGTYSSLIKIYNIKGQDAIVENAEYKPYMLFKEYPQQGKWFWPISKQLDIDKEFLMNCLTGFYLEE